MLRENTILKCDKMILDTIKLKGYHTFPGIINGPIEREIMFKTLSLIK